MFNRKKKTFENKNVLVVSATSELAKEAMVSLRDQGANIFMIARNEKKLKKERSDFIKQKNYSVADVTKLEDVKRSIADAEEYFGKKEFDYIFFYQGYIRAKQIRELRLEQIIKSNDVNYLSCVYYVKHMLNNKNIAKNSHVVFISSVSSTLMCPEAFTYVSSKRSLETFADELIYELAPRGVDITVAKPGFFKSGFVRGNDFLPWLMTAKKTSDRILESVLKRKYYIKFPMALDSIITFLHFLKTMFPNIFHTFSLIWYNRKRRLLNLGQTDMCLEKEINIEDKFGWKRLAFGLLPGFISKKIFKIK